MFCDEGREAAADLRYADHVSFYTECGVSNEQLRFGAGCNHLEDSFATGGTKKMAAKKGKREVYLKDLSDENAHLFTGDDGSDNIEWNAWKDMDAAEIVDVKKTEEIRKVHKSMIISACRVRTDKAESGDNMKAKSRLVVQGFKDRALGEYRRGAAKASPLAESPVLLW